MNKDGPSYWYLVANTSKFMMFSPTIPRLWRSGHALIKQERLCFPILQQFLAFNPSRRISAFAALSHPYFQSVDSHSRSIYAAQPIPSNKPTLEERTAWCRPPSYSYSLVRACGGVHVKQTFRVCCVIFLDASPLADIDRFHLCCQL